MSIILHDARTPTESAKKAAWLNFMDDSGDPVDAVRSTFMARGRAEVWRRDDPGFAEGFDARYRDVDRRVLNSARRQAQAGDLRAAALCLRYSAGGVVRTPDDVSSAGLPTDVASAMLAAGLAAMHAIDGSTVAFGSSSMPSHACPPAPRRRRR